jgi:peptide/nickel transport system substrate-binding protein
MKRGRKAVLRNIAVAFCIATLSVGAVDASKANELRIGSRIEVIMDPHFSWSAANLQFYFQYLGYLVNQGAHNEALPGLAISFEPKSDTTWEFKLRPGLRFDNGTPLTPQDIIASYTRARTLPNAIGSYAGLFTGVKEIKAIDETALQIITERPYPTLPVALTQVAVLPKAIAETATQADFISGQGNVGSGQYKFVEYKPSEHLVLARNDLFYGDKARWDKVTFRFMKDDAARVAALLSGDVDVADGIPTADVDRIKKDSRFTLHAGPSDRVAFLQLDNLSDVTPDITGNDGKPLDKNPLKDKRVRQALSLAIDRGAIRDRIMNGLSFPTNQLVSEGVGGYSKDIPPARYDAKDAQRLLKEAGWGDGFQLVLRCPMGRLVNDVRICQALGQMFGRINIKVTVQAEPQAVYLSRLRKEGGPQASVFMSSWSSAASGEADVLQNCFHTRDPATKLGTWNLSHYSNPALDRIIAEYLAIVDKDKRQALQREAMKIAMEDVAAIPLHAQSVAVATRKGMDFTTYFNEATIADLVRPAAK